MPFLLASNLIPEVSEDYTRSNDMRRYLGSLAFMGCALLAVPVSADPSASETSSVDAGPAVAVHQVQDAATGRDQATMVLVGTALIGLAAAVRRAA